MNLSYKYRLQPTPAQTRILEEQLNLCRLTYNALLDHCYDERRAGRGTTALPVDRPILGRRWMIGFQESIVPPRKEGKKLMWVIDITADENPVSVATFDVPVENPDKIDETFGPHQPFEDVHLKDNLVYASWFGGGLRIVDVSNPYRPVEVGHFLPKCERQKMVQTNDVFVDDRGLIYTIDRLERGLDILEFTGPRLTSSHNTGNR